MKNYYLRLRKEIIDKEIELKKLKKEFDRHNHIISRYNDYFECEICNKKWFMCDKSIDTHYYLNDINKDNNELYYINLLNGSKYYLKNFNWKSWMAIKNIYTCIFCGINNDYCSMKIGDK